MFLRPDIQFKLAMQGELSVSRAFWVVTVLYGYCGIFLILMTSYLLRFNVNEKFLNDLQVFYMCFGVFASFRCTVNIQTLWLRWLSRLLLGMVAFWLILALHNFVTRTIG